MQLKWHPFQLNPSAPKEGIVKREYYRSKFGIQSEQMEARMAEVLLMNNSEAISSWYFVLIDFSPLSAKLLYDLGIFQVFRGLGLDYDMSGLT